MHHKFFNPPYRMSKLMLHRHHLFHRSIITATIITEFGGSRLYQIPARLLVYQRGPCDNFSHKTEMYSTLMENRIENCGYEFIRTYLSCNPPKSICSILEPEIPVERLEPVGLSTELKSKISVKMLNYKKRVSRYIVVALLQDAQLVCDTV